MKKKGKSDFTSINSPFSLKTQIEKDVLIVQSFDPDNTANFDKSIHHIRRSLKAIHAVQLLYRRKINPLIFSNWENQLKVISKQYGSLRDPYVFLQTFNELENKLKVFDNPDFIELRHLLETKYNQNVKDNQDLPETLRHLNNLSLKLFEVIHFSDTTSTQNSLKKEHLKTFQKTQKLFNKLRQTSSSENFHKCRKWARYLYLQEKALSRFKLEILQPKEIKRLHKLTGYLGNEHDLQVFNKYLKAHFYDLSGTLRPLVLLKIQKMRRKALGLYPEIFSNNLT